MVWLNFIKERYFFINYEGLFLSHSNKDKGMFISNDIVESFVINHFLSNF